LCPSDDPYIAATGQKFLGSGPIIFAFAEGAEHLRTPPNLDGAMVSGTEKYGWSSGRLIVVGDYHFRRGDVVR
jgi:hypothetical protein